MKKLIALAMLLITSFAGAQSKKDIFELSAVGVSIAADGWSTQYNRGGELNPIARPFVKSTGGSVAYFGGSFAAVLLANHLLRNHPKMRHTFNWTLVANESYWTVSNVRGQMYWNACARQWIVKGVACH